MTSSGFWLVVMLGISTWLWGQLTDPCHDWALFTLSVLLTVGQALIFFGYLFGYLYTRKQQGKKGP